MHIIQGPEPWPGGTGTENHGTFPSPRSPRSLLPPTAPTQPRPPEPGSQGHLPWARSDTHCFGVKPRLGPNSSTCPPVGDGHTRRSHASLLALQTPGPCASGLPSRASPSGSPWSAAYSSRPWWRWRWRPRSRAAEQRWEPPGHNFRSPAPEGDSL